MPPSCTLDCAHTHGRPLLADTCSTRWRIRLQQRISIRAVPLRALYGPDSAETMAEEKRKMHEKEAEIEKKRKEKE